jgi:hypothetical protein
MAKSRDNRTREDKKKKRAPKKKLLATPQELLIRKPGQPSS